MVVVVAAAVWLLLLERRAPRGHWCGLVPRDGAGGIDSSCQPLRLRSPLRQVVLPPAWQGECSVCKAGSPPVIMLH